MAGWTPLDMWSTIRRARLIRVLAVYVGASFAVLEGVSIVTDQVGLPDWVVPFALVLLLIGLPIIIATALAQSAPAAALTAPAALGLEPGMWSAAPEPPPSAAEAAAVAKRWLTWRKAMLGGLLAFALWGIVVTGYMVMRALGIGPVGSLVAAGVLDERDRIIVADFENHTDDPLLAGAVGEALRIDLAQSPLVTLVQPAYVASILERMERAVDAPLDLELAREIAIRGGVKAAIGGEINAAGRGYVLSLRLVSAATGETFAAFRETAKDADAVIGAIDKISNRLRERIGESLKTIRGNEPLARVTTSSLEALRKYSQAVRAIEVLGDDELGIALLEEAVRADTAFAMAWRKLGVTLSNQFEQRARQVEALTRAYEHRDRLPERERYRTVASYHDNVTGELTRAITAYRALLEIEPTETGALNNLAWALWLLEDYEEAERIAGRALEVDSTVAFHYVNLIVPQIGLGRFEDAAATAAVMREKLRGNPWALWISSFAAAAHGDYDVAEGYLRALAEEHKRSLLWRGNASGLLGLLASVRGRMAEAERHSRDALAVQAQRGLPGTYLGAAIQLARLTITFRGDLEGGLGGVEAALLRYPLDSIAPLDRPYLSLANLFARAERPERARALIREYEERIDPALRRADEPLLQYARGLAALVEGRPRGAIVEFRAFDESPTSCPICGLPDLGRAYELAVQRDSALAIYERYVTTPIVFRLFSDAWDLAFVYERLGALHEERGDAEKASYYYGKLVELWQEADPELQPRVEAARRAIRVLSPDR